MNKTKIICGIGATVLITILIVAPAVIGRPVRLLQKQNIAVSVQPITSDLVYVGDMYIEGTGHYETSIVMATAEQNIRIKVDPGGSDVVIKAKYLLQCVGDFDYGYAMLSVGGVQAKDVETSSYAEGYLYTTVHDCKLGDIIIWILYVEYGDLFFPRPIVDIEGGGGICNHLIFNNVARQVPNTQTIISGTIICQ